MPSVSPWWYRRRDAVFGMLYGIGFFLGGLISGFTRGRYVPIYVDVANRFRHGGVALVGAAMLCLMIGCFALRVWGSSYLRARVVWNENAVADQFVVSGPFRFTRNPLYLGNVLMAASMGAFAPAAGWLIINVLNAVFIVALVRWEERGLRERYGERFERYCKEVPMLLPRLIPASGSGHAVASLGEGMRAEIFTGCMVAATIALLLSPRVYGWTVFAVLFVTGMTAQRLAAGRGMQTAQLP